MKQIIGISIIVLLVSCLTLCGDASAKDHYYWINKNVTVLVFIGNPHGLEFEYERYTTSQSQRIKLFHKRSGYGIYAFHLTGLMIKGEDGPVEKEGYFLVKKRHIRKDRYKIKQSMKLKTQKGG